MRINSLRAVILAWLNAFQKSWVGVGMKWSVSGEVISVVSAVVNCIPRYIRTYLHFSIQQWGNEGGGRIPRHCMLRFVSTITAQRPITVSGFPPPYGISCIGSRLFSFGFPICEYVFSSRMFTEAPVSIISRHSTSSSLATVNGVFVFLS